MVFRTVRKTELIVALSEYFLRNGKTLNVQFNDTITYRKKGGKPGVLKFVRGPQEGVRSGTVTVAEGLPASSTPRHLM